MLRALVEGADLSAWGLAYAITRTAQDAATFDRSVELEAAGGQLLALPPARLRELVQGTSPAAPALARAA